MDFERIEPGRPEWTLYYPEHVQRYRFAAETLRARPPGATLDAACGVGYGARVLAEALGGRVVAVDRDPRALARARSDFAHERVTFLDDDCSTLAAAQALAPFDAVVSFETVEHLREPGRFLDRCRALLRETGTLVVSTPNVRVRSECGHFHEKEYTAPEFVDLLSSHGFGAVDLYAQRMTALGRLRDQVRAEVQALRSSPFARLGSLLQRVLRGRARPGPALPPDDADYEIVPVESARAVEAMGPSGPAVLVAVASRGS